MRRERVERNPPLQPDCRYMASPLPPPPLQEGHLQQVNISVEVLNWSDREERGGADEETEGRQGEGRR